MTLLVPPPIVALLCGFAIWALSVFGPPLDVHIPGQGILAYLLAGCGFVLDAASIAAFIRSKTTFSPMSPQNTTTLVETGFYRISRNPMYLGLLLILSGFAVLRGSALGLLVLAFFVAYITAFQIKPEEEQLRAHFGPAYDAYKSRVRRWL